MNNLPTSEILTFINNAPIDNEIEIMFFNYKINNKLSYQKFTNYLKYVKIIAKKLNIKLTSIYELDILYNHDNSKYRYEISDLDNINNIINLISDKPKHIGLSYLLDESNKLVTKKNIIQKVRKDTLDINEYDIRLRNSEENNIPEKKIIDLLLKTYNNQNSHSKDNKTINEINYRYKQRLSAYVEDNNEYQLRIDLTIVKHTDDISMIKNIYDNYEIEFEIIKKKKVITNISPIITFIYNALLVFQQSPFIVSKTLSSTISTNIKNLLNSKYLSLKNVFSLDKNTVTSILPTNYCVSYKIDGFRYLLFLYNDTCYFVSSSFDVKITNIKIPKEYNNTIIDGEYIFDAKTKKHIYYAFDILYYKNKDVRGIEDIKKRYKLVLEVMTNCYNFTYNFAEYVGNYDINKMSDYYKLKLKEYKEYTLKLLEDKKIIHIFPIYVLFTTGAHKCEVFNLSKLIWESNFYLPLDGMIYYPMMCKYNDNNFKIYKWKPPHLNSIDFYVTFKKIKSDIISVFDKTQTDATYRICELHCYETDKDNKHYPVEFHINPNDTMNTCYLEIKNNNVTDISGNIIPDNTVVEFVYNNDPKIHPKFRWTPIKIRYDKTEFVRLFGQKYGNILWVGQHIFSTILENFTFSDIINLSTPELYDKNMSTILYQATKTSDKTQSDKKSDNKFDNKFDKKSDKKLDKKSDINTEISTLKEVTYDKSIDNSLINDFENHLNYVKNNIINFYLHQQENTKILNYNFLNYKLFDKYTVDNVINKINNYKSKTIIQSNNWILENDIKNKYDVIIVDNILHYMTSDVDTFNKFMASVYSRLNPFGYLIIFAYDYNIDNDILNITSINGENINYLEFKNNFDISNTKNFNQFGLNVDVLNYGKKDSIYLIHPDFFKFKNLHLIETALFSTFSLNSKIITLKPFIDLHRYYIFQKF